MSNGESAPREPYIEGIYSERTERYRTTRNEVLKQVAERHRDNFNSELARLIFDQLPEQIIAPAYNEVIELPSSPTTSEATTSRLLPNNPTATVLDYLYSVTTALEQEDPAHPASLTQATQGIPLFDQKEEQERRPLLNEMRELWKNTPVEDPAPPSVDKPRSRSTQFVVDLANSFMTRLTDHDINYRNNFLQGPGPTRLNEPSIQEEVKRRYWSQSPGVASVDLEETHPHVHATEQKPLGPKDRAVIADADLEETLSPPPAPAPDDSETTALKQSLESKIAATTTLRDRLDVINQGILELKADPAEKQEQLRTYLQESSVFIEQKLLGKPYIRLNPQEKAAILTTALLNKGFFRPLSDQLKESFPLQETIARDLLMIYESLNLPIRLQEVFIFNPGYMELLNPTIVSLLQADTQSAIEGWLSVHTELGTVGAVRLVNHIGLSIDNPQDSSVQVAINALHSATRYSQAYWPKALKPAIKAIKKAYQNGDPISEIPGNLHYLKQLLNYQSALEAVDKNPTLVLNDSQQGAIRLVALERILPTFGTEQPRHRQLLLQALYTQGESIDPGIRGALGQACTTDEEIRKRVTTDLQVSTYNLALRNEIPPVLGKRIVLGLETLLSETDYRRLILTKVAQTNQTYSMEGYLASSPLLYTKNEAKLAEQALPWKLKIVELTRGDQGNWPAFLVTKQKKALEQLATREITSESVQELEDIFEQWSALADLPREDQFPQDFGLHRFLRTAIPNVVRGAHERSPHATQLRARTILQTYNTHITKRLEGSTFYDKYNAHAHANLICLAMAAGTEAELVLPDSIKAEIKNNSGLRVRLIEQSAGFAHAAQLDGTTAVPRPVWYTGNHTRYSNNAAYLTDLEGEQLDHWVRGWVSLHKLLQPEGTAVLQQLVTDLADQPGAPAYRAAQEALAQGNQQEASPLHQSIDDAFAKLLSQYDTLDDQALEDAIHHFMDTVNEELYDYLREHTLTDLDPAQQDILLLGLFLAPNSYTLPPNWQAQYEQDKGFTATFNSSFERIADRLKINNLQPTTPLGTRCINGSMTFMSRLKKNTPTTQREAQPALPSETATSKIDAFNQLFNRGSEFYDTPNPYGSALTFFNAEQETITHLLTEIDFNAFSNRARFEFIAHLMSLGSDLPRYVPQPFLEWLGQASNKRVFDNLVMSVPGRFKNVNFDAMCDLVTQSKGELDRLLTEGTTATREPQPIPTLEKDDLSVAIETFDFNYEAMEQAPNLVAQNFFSNNDTAINTYFKHNDILDLPEDIQRTFVILLLCQRTLTNDQTPPALRDWLVVNANNAEAFKTLVTKVFKSIPLKYDATRTAFEIGQTHLYESIAVESQAEPANTPEMTAFVGLYNHSSYKTALNRGPEIARQQFANSLTIINEFFNKHTITELPPEVQEVFVIYLMCQYSVTNDQTPPGLLDWILNDTDNAEAFESILDRASKEIPSHYTPLKKAYAEGRGFLKDRLQRERSKRTANKVVDPTHENAPVKHKKVRRTKGPESPSQQVSEFPELGIASSRDIVGTFTQISDMSNLLWIVLKEPGKPYRLQRVDGLQTIAGRSTEPLNILTRTRLAGTPPSPEVVIHPQPLVITTAQAIKANTGEHIVSFHGQETSLDGATSTPQIVNVNESEALSVIVRLLESRVEEDALNEKHTYIGFTPQVLANHIQWLLVFPPEDGLGPIGVRLLLKDVLGKLIVIDEGDSKNKRGYLKLLTNDFSAELEATRQLLAIEKELASQYKNHGELHEAALQQLATEREAWATYEQQRQEYNKRRVKLFHTPPQKPTFSHDTAAIPLDAVITELFEHTLTNQDIPRLQTLAANMNKALKVTQTTRTKSSEKPQQAGGGSGGGRRLWWFRD